MQVLPFLLISEGKTMDNMGGPDGCQVKRLPSSWFGNHTQTSCILVYSCTTNAWAAENGSQLLIDTSEFAHAESGAVFKITKLKLVIHA